VVVSAITWGNRQKFSAEKKDRQYVKKNTHKPEWCACVFDRKQAQNNHHTAHRPSTAISSLPIPSLGHCLQHLFVLSSSFPRLPSLSLFPPPIPSPTQLYFHPRKTQKKKREIKKITERVLNHKLGCSTFYSLRREAKEGYRSTSSSQTLIPFRVCT
jgi:hypothetical protein